MQNAKPRPIDALPSDVAHALESLLSHFWHEEQRYFLALNYTDRDGTLESVFLHMCAVYAHFYAEEVVIEDEESEEPFVRRTCDLIVEYDPFSMKTAKQNSPC